MRKLKFLILSLPLATTMFPYSVAHGALRINNSSVTAAKIQNMAAAREMAAAAYTQNAPQPARTVTDANGNTTTISDAQLDACNAIYPGGTFDWTRPTMGMHAGDAATCSSYVELRAYNGGGTTYNVLATGYLASGDAVRCNIDSFPDITVVGRDFTYPADNPPTMEDVERVMAAENKANAGFKILATAVVGGLGGNLLGKGDDGFGTNKEKLKTTALGAVGGAALMTASTQINDYKTGSVILSTGTNMAAGAVAGNVMASGDEVLQIDNCPDVDGLKGAQCIFGTVSTGESKTVKSGTQQTITTNYTVYVYDRKNRYAYECTQYGSSSYYEQCHRIQLSNLKFEDIDECKEADVNISKDCEAKLANLSGDKTYKLRDDKKTILNGGELEKASGDDKGDYIKIESAKTAGSRTGAVIKLAGEYKNIFGYKREDWRERNKTNSKIKIADGETVYDLYGKQIEDKKIADFNPAYKTASDGGVIDFNNAARTKSTLIGAGTGGALGALSGAAGADAAINERYLTALREYEGSLSNIVCYTGARYLAKYNDAIIIPEMKNFE
ncbi:MAG: hypothetical protein ACLRFM_01090 [Alphaproteobacteria bacterium]